MPDAAVKAMAQYRDKLYIATDRAVYRYDADRDVVELFEYMPSRFMQQLLDSQALASRVTRKSFDIGE